ncbi:MAG: T9SS type A sorting domain-containing protein [Bacteroidia bacterium]
MNKFLTFSFFLFLMLGFSPRAKAQCDASFYTIDSLGYVFFINTSSGYDPNNVAFFWDFGDSSYDNTHSPSHAYSSYGYYNVCLYISDTIQNRCDSTCNQVANFSQTAISETPVIQALVAGPNPINDLLTLNINMQTTARVRVCLYDLRGSLAQTLADETFSAGQTQEAWDVSGLPAGTYLLRLESAGSAVSTRIVVLRP